MLEYGWRLTQPGSTFEFGGVDYASDPFRRGLGRVTVTNYEVGDVELTTEDSDRPRRDGKRFGEDFRRGLTHTFTLLARGRTRLEAEQLIGQAAAAWRGDGVRSTPDAYAELTTLQGGVVKSMRGRPRRFAPNYDRLAGSNTASAVCTFDTVDDFWLGAPQFVRIDLRTVLDGGIVGPLVSPIVSTAPTDRAGTLNVGGTLPAYVTLEIHGPTAGGAITAPGVKLIGGWAFKMLTSVGFGRVVTADPQRGSVIDQAGASYAGGLARGTRLSKLLLLPGRTNTLQMTGTDATQTAYFVARWRDTFAGRF